MKKAHLNILLEKIAVLDVMARYNVSSKEAKLLLTYPDLSISRQVTEQEARPI